MSEVLRINNFKFVLSSRQPNILSEKGYFEQEARLSMRKDMQIRQLIAQIDGVPRIIKPLKPVWIAATGDSPIIPDTYRLRFTTEEPPSQDLVDYYYYLQGLKVVCNNTSMLEFLIHSEGTVIECLNKMQSYGLIVIDQ